MPIPSPQLTFTKIISFSPFTHPFIYSPYVMARVSLSIVTRNPIFSVNTSASGLSSKLNWLKLYPDSGLTLPETFILIFNILSLSISTFFINCKISLHNSSSASDVFSDLKGIFIFNSTISPLKLIRPMLIANFLISTPMKYPDSGFRPYKLG